MSLPVYPDKSLQPTRDEAINQIISSIAMEELGLSHIINAEGEKLQYALGTIPGMPAQTELLSQEDLLELNKSIRATLDSTMMNQFLLKEKLHSALSASVMQGPTGPAGPQGPATIRVDSEAMSLDPDEAPTVTNIGESDQDVVLKFGIPRGATGATGATGADGATGAPGAVEATGIQVMLVNDGTSDPEISQNEVVLFNQISGTSGTDISYDTTSGIFTVNLDRQSNLYLINWQLFVEGSAESPITFALDVGGTIYPTSIPWVEATLASTTLAIVGNEPVNISLSNISGSTVMLSDIDVQAQMNIVGFRRAN